MAESNTCQKKWKESVRSADFDHSETKILGKIAHDPNQAYDYMARASSKIVHSKIPQLSTHSVSINQS